MRRWMLLAGLGAFLVLGAGRGVALAQHDHGEPAKKKETKKRKVLHEPSDVLCPVSGKPANLVKRVAAEDGPIFFCCLDCIKTYGMDREKYADKIAAQRKVLAGLPKVQVTCPLDGKMISKKSGTKFNGQTVLFCSNQCRDRFEREPRKHRGGVANSYTYQTKCPVMGGDIDPEAFAVFPAGEKIYYCCMKCDEKFRASPERYLSNLEKQGIKISLDRLRKGSKGK